MTYTTEQDMIDLFGIQEMIELTNLDDPNATIVDSTRLNTAISHASFEIDSYLRGQYKLPLDSIPIVLTYKAADLARYHLDSYQAREDVRQRYMDALAWLKLLAEGKVSLGLDSNNEEVLPTSGGAKSAGEDRVFTRSSLGDFTAMITRTY